MANTSILNAFERMWQHIVAKLEKKENKIYKQNEAPTDAEEGALWLDTDEEAAVSSGSGGVTSWNDLEDKPFYTTTETIEVIPRQTIGKHELYDPENNTAYFNIIANDCVLENGRSYSVQLNGAEYIVEATQVIFNDDNKTKVIMVGNHALAINLVGSWSDEIIDTGEPFVLVYLPDADAGAGAGFAWDVGYGETIDVKVSEEREAVKTIDNKYLPAGSVSNILPVVLYADIVEVEEYDPYGGVNYTVEKKVGSCDKTFNEIVTAVKNGMAIFAVTRPALASANKNTYVHKPVSAVHAVVDADDDDNFPYIEFDKIFKDDDYAMLKPDNTVEFNTRTIPS